MQINNFEVYKDIYYQDTKIVIYWYIKACQYIKYRVC